MYVSRWKYFSSDYWNLKSYQQHTFLCPVWFQGSFAENLVFLLEALKKGTLPCPFFSSLSLPPRSPTQICTMTCESQTQWTHFFFYFHFLFFFFFIPTMNTLMSFPPENTILLELLYLIGLVWRFQCQIKCGWNLYNSMPISDHHKRVVSPRISQPSATGQHSGSLY